MKRRDFLKKLGLKTGLDQTEIDDLLTDLDGEIDDTKADAAIKSVYTSDEALGNDELFQKALGKGKAEALNPIDAMLKSFESKLKPEEKTLTTNWIPHTRSTSLCSNPSRSAILQRVTPTMTL